jgi:hypothetical protein
MNTFIRKLNWRDQLYLQKGAGKIPSQKFKHERWKYKLLTFIEQKVLGGGENFDLRIISYLMFK